MSVNGFTDHQGTRRFAPLKARTRASFRRAFTLVEVMAAVGVLSLALSSTILVLKPALSNLESARMSDSAVQIVQSEIERLRLKNWASISALPASEVINISAIHSSIVTDANRFTITRTITDVAGRGTPSTMKQITLTATWTSRDGQSHQRRFLMRYAKDGLFDYYYNSAQS